MVSEIYLTKNYVSTEEWLELIKVISNYHGILRKWKLVVTNDRNKIRYFVESRCSLPASISNLDAFLLKRTSKNLFIKHHQASFAFLKMDSNIIDLVEYHKIKNRGTLHYLEISFCKLYEDKIKSRIHFFLKKGGRIKKYKALFAIPAEILSVDFGRNKRYFYGKAPKYLDINKILHLLNTDKDNALLHIDTFPYLQGNFYLSQNNFSFDKHSIIMGASGSGKSKFISMLIHNISKNEKKRQKYKIVVIDPHASLEDDIGGLGRVIDFKNTKGSIDLFINHNGDIISSTELLLDLLKSLIADQYNSKLERVLRHSIYLLLTEESFNFESLRKLLLDLEYRNDLIGKLKKSLPMSVIEFFLSDFNDLKTKSYGEAISPIIGFIDEMEMLPAFHSEEKYDNLTDTLHDYFLTIFSLDRTKLGDKVTKTISGLLLQQLLTIMQKREIPEHIILIIDEVAVVENPILSNYLSEARKYNLSLIMAGQYFNQISDYLKSSIFANVSNYFIFRVSKLDATTLVENFNMKIPLGDTKEQKIKLLTELNSRECIARIDTNGILLPAFKAATLNYTSIPRIKEEIINFEQEYSKENRKKSKFTLDGNVRLKDILISNSTSRRGIIKDE